MGRNILANALGGSWWAVLSLLIIPVQIGTFGDDAYGLLAFLATVQVIFSVFDLGLSPTISRELATDASPDLGHSRELLRTLSVAYAVVGLLLGGALFGGAGWLVDHWLRLGEELPADVARSALRFGALAILLRWPVSFASGVLVGRGRFDVLNGLKAVAATVGLLGGTLVILAFEDLVLFAAWTALAALVEIALYAVACFRLIPGLSLRPRVSRRAVAQVRGFALGVGVINVLGIALTQSDRLLLSALVPIETLGHYSLAYNVLLGLTLVQGFFTSALFPSFAASFARGDQEKLASDYNRATQGLVYVCALPVAALAFFGEPLLAIWTSPQTAAPTARILLLLAPAFLLSVAVAIPYTLALATGRTGIVIGVFAAAMVVYFPLLFFAIGRWGGVGAAAVWLLLNVSHLFTLVPLVQRRLVLLATRDWLGRNLLPFLAAGALAFGVGRGLVVVAGWEGTAAVWGVVVAASVAYGLGGLRLLDPSLREDLRRLPRRPVRGGRRAELG